MKRGDIIRLTADDPQNAFNRRNGLPRYRAQEVLAVLKPGERACDHGFHGAVYGYLNDGMNRILINNNVGSRLNRDRFFWPFRHDAPDPPEPKYATVRYTKTLKICDSDGTATAAINEDLSVPQDCQARAESIATPNPETNNG